MLTVTGKVKAKGLAVFRQGGLVYSATGESILDGHELRYLWRSAVMA